MRLLLTAILSLGLGLLPVTNARADVPADAAPAMACHEMMGAGMAMNGGDEQPSHDMQVCADHCLSQVNGQTMQAPAPGPALTNEIRAELGGEIHLGKVHTREPPDPPPPRS
jgi:hypothetical protein